MNKPIITFGIIIFILVSSFIAIILPFLVELSSHHPAASCKINNYISVVNAGMSNLYIISNDKTSICIDAGANLKKTKQELLRLKINPDSVEAVFLTHSDRDHIAALDLFKKAQIYISRDEEAMILAKKPRFFGFIRNKLPIPYQTLSDGSEINAGGIIVLAIATPGHTPGSMCYLVNKHYLFTGDSLGLKEGAVTLFTPHFFNMDEATCKASILKLSQLTGVSWVGTGHHGFSKDFGYAFEKWKN